MNQLTINKNILISVMFTLMLFNTLKAAEFVVQTALDLGGSTVISEISPGVYTINTLRSAVEQANDEVNFPGPDIIRFDENIEVVDPGVITTITLGLVGDQFNFQTQSSNSALGIDSSITIQGTLPESPEPPITLEALGLRHFQVNNGGKLRLYDLTLSSGETPVNNSGRGGAVVVDGNGQLEVRNSTFFMNEAVNGGALAFQSGSLDALIENSAFYFNDASDNNAGTLDLGLGGAIFSESDSHTITIINGSFNNNYADAHGGAIYFNHPLMVQNSQFYRNDADLNGGALYALSLGSATISNAVFFENKALMRGGAIYTNSLGIGSIEIVNSTLTKNDAGLDLNRHAISGLQTVGGAIYSVINSNILLHNNVISENKNAGTTFDDISAEINGDSSYNLIGLNSGSLFGVTDQVNGNLIGTISDPIDARIKLDDFFSYVIGLESDSPAVNSGSNTQTSNSGLIFDLFGNDRIIGPAVDRGAIETDIFFYDGFE